MSVAQLNLSTKALKAQNQGHAISGIFIDFAKAFDTIKLRYLAAKVACIISVKILYAGSVVMFQ